MSLSYFLELSKENQNDGKEAERLPSQTGVGPCQLESDEEEYQPKAPSGRWKLS